MTSQKSELHRCLGCGKEAKYSILLASGPHGSSNPTPRWYIPNQAVREADQQHEGFPSATEVWFCHSCMRKIEDNFRATLLYLQTENNLITPNPNIPELSY